MRGCGQDIIQVYTCFYWIFGVWKKDNGSSDNSLSAVCHQ